MEPNQQPTPAAIATPAPSSGKSKFGAGSITFLVGILLFLMPFVNLKCSDMTIKQVRGYELATGFTIEDKSTNSLLGNTYSNTNTKKSEKKDPNTYALIALGLGILGLVVSLGSSKGRSMLASVLGVAGAVALIVLMIDVKKQLKLETPADTNTSTSDFNYNLNDIKITAEFTPWFYLTVILFIVAAVICWQRSKKKA